MEKMIIPAIIAKSQEELDNKLNKVKDLVEMVQLDVMDGFFVKNISLDFDFKLPSGEYQAHLMVSNPMEWVKENWRKVACIIAHIESCENPQEIIDFVKGKKRKIGFSLNPKTSLDTISKYLDELDLVQIMTIEPGFYGSEFIPSALDKIKYLRRHNPKLDIQVDGGINPETIKLAMDAGANLFACGSYIMDSENAERAISSLRQWEQELKT